MQWKGKCICEDWKQEKHFQKGKWNIFQNSVFPIAFRKQVVILLLLLFFSLICNEREAFGTLMYPTSAEKVCSLPIHKKYARTKVC